MIALSRLYIHPVKSMAVLRQSQSLVQPDGLAFDRRFMITEADGTFITARQLPELVLFRPVPTPDGLFITAPDGAALSISLSEFSPLPKPAQVWGSHFNTRVASRKVNQWLSNALGHEVQLRWTGPQAERRVDHYPDIPLSFADGSPFMLMNEASLRYLQQRCPASISMTHFRPNLVVSGAAPWAEDEWQKIRIGTVIFDVVKPCSRCIITTISPERGEKHPNEEPLRTLKAFRTAPNGKIDVGLNLIARNSGAIREGDKVQILATHRAVSYGADETEMPPTGATALHRAIEIEWQGKKFTGDDRQILLEQLEQQGICIPYSCRVGICESCRVRLVEGEVRPLRHNAFDPLTGTILACSCVPVSGLKLTADQTACSKE